MANTTNPTIRELLDTADGISSCYDDSLHLLRQCHKKQMQKRLFDSAIERALKASENSSFLSICHAIHTIEDTWGKDPDYYTDENIFILAKFNYQIGLYHRSAELFCAVSDKGAFPSIKQDFYNACFGLMCLNETHSPEIAFRMLQNYKGQFDLIKPDEVDSNHQEKEEAVFPEVVDDIKIDMSLVKMGVDTTSSKCDNYNFGLFFLLVAGFYFFANYMLPICLESSNNTILGDIDFAPEDPML